MKSIITILSILISLYIIQAQENFKYRHILITNDDGKEDSDRLFALAKSVKKVAKRVSIIVSAFDRSGTSNYTTFGKYQSTIEIECKYYDEENNIAAYVIPGNPADCVLIGLMGLFNDDRPDLVLSGINGGANIGPGWFGSGTIGAIRTSALLGVRGIALSGFDDDDERSFKYIPDWITRFISTDFVDKIDKNSYLTIGFPKIPLEKIKGIKIAKRKISYNKTKEFGFYKIFGEEPHKPENSTVWVIKKDENPAGDEIDNDETFLQQGYIVITPMTIDENNTDLLQKFKEIEKQMPEFTLD